MKPEPLALVGTERRALVQERIADQVPPPLRHRHGVGLPGPGRVQFACLACRQACRFPPSVPTAVSHGPRDGYSARPCSTSGPTTPPPRIQLLTRPALEGDVHADVCVVGGGIAGCSAALDLAARGYRVVLARGAQVGWGASGRSGGQAIFGFGASQQAIVADAGLDDARRMWDVSIEALALPAPARRRSCNRLRPAMGPPARRDQGPPAARARGLQARARGPLRLSATPRLLDRAGVESLLATRPLLRRTLRPRQRTPAPAQLHPRARARARKPAAPGSTNPPS